MLLVDQLDDKALLSRLLQAMYEELPEPKKKKLAYQRLVFLCHNHLIFTMKANSDNVFLAMRRYRLWNTSKDKRYLENEHICCAISNNKDAQVSVKKLGYLSALMMDLFF